MIVTVDVLVRAATPGRLPQILSTPQSPVSKPQDAKLQRLSHTYIVKHRYTPTSSNTDTHIHRQAQIHTYIVKHRYTRAQSSNVDTSSRTGHATHKSQIDPRERQFPALFPLFVYFANSHVHIQQLTMSPNHVGGHPVAQ